MLARVLELLNLHRLGRAGQRCRKGSSVSQVFLLPSHRGRNPGAAAGMIEKQNFFERTGIKFSIVAQF